MNLQSEVLFIIDKLSQSRSLNSVHLSDNGTPLPDIKVAYEKMGLPHLFKNYFKSPQEEDRQAVTSATKEFRDIKQSLFAPEFEKLTNTSKRADSHQDEGTVPGMAEVEQNLCFMLNCYHLKQVNSGKFRQKNLEQEVHRGLQCQRSVANSQPLFFYREFAHREHKIFETIKENLLDYPNSARWQAPIDQRCYICERHVSIQVFFNPAVADQEWTKITDNKVKQYLMRVYNLKS